MYGYVHSCKVCMWGGTIVLCVYMCTVVNVCVRVHICTNMYIALKSTYVYKCVYMYSVVMGVCTSVYRYVDVHRSEECGRGMK